jgi:hypothetical protein
MPAPVRAAVVGAEAAVAVCAITCVPVIETASIATKDAFLKLMSNSLLSWRLVHCHSA